MLCVLGRLQDVDWVSHGAFGLKLVSPCVHA